MERLSAFTAALIAAAGISAAPLWAFGTSALAQPDTMAARPVPLFELQQDFLKIPAGMKLGAVSDIEIDSHDNIWVTTRPRTLKGDDKDHAAPPILEFDAQGYYIKGWGGPGPGYQWPEREHSAYIDYKGFVWITGNYCKETNTPGLDPVDDDQLLKFTQDGKFVMQLGHSSASKGNSDTVNFNRPAYVQVDPRTNELYVADGYGNHRIIVLDADTGKFKRMWGAFGKPPVDDDHCGGREPQTFSGDGPASFSTPHTIRLGHDGLLYVVDRENRRLQVFTTEGKFVRQVTRYDAPFARNLAFSSDPNQTYLYVGYGKGIGVFDRKTLAYVTTIAPPGILGNGHLIDTDSNGNIYITGANGKIQMQRLLYRGMGQAGQQ